MGLSRYFSEDGVQLIIALDKTFNFNMVNEFRDAYSEGTSEIKKITIDMEKTQYIDSSALGLLLNMHKSMEGQVSSFTICNVGSKVAKIFEISRFDKKFEIIEAES
ncbi:STAS domain-containing protein [Alteromonas sp. a30]|uniref:STAS domain-containing protein n=1 Tax=Alteromonas sp. a30 TaxID=2730917 RepID=UPI00227E440D|nr:STAS domain-containing protein [Alteromonas sp. a30]MCY7295844.1 STAS domain-containing protein [Alteromonas sp. a30]